MQTRRYLGNVIGYDWMTTGTGQIKLYLSVRDLDKRFTKPARFHVGVLETVKDIEIGDIVEVGKPMQGKTYIRKLVEKGKERSPILHPERCPCCHRSIVTLPTGNGYKCEHYRCRKQTIERLKYYTRRLWIGKGILNLKVFEKILDKYPECDLDILYTLNESEWMEMLNFEWGKYHLLQRDIKTNIKEMGLWEMLNAMGCPNVIPEKIKKTFGKKGSLKQLYKYLAKEEKTLDTLTLKEFNRITGWLSCKDRKITFLRLSQLPFKSINLNI